MTDQELFEAISEVLCWNNRFIYLCNARKYPKGTKFYRVKRLEGSGIPNERFSVYDDYWETAPKFLKKYNRINKPGEPMLYVSPDVMCSIDEVKVRDENLFVVIRYTAVDEIKATIICGEYNYDEIGIKNYNARLVNEIYNDFLKSEFCKDVGQGTEYLYRVSEMIAKSYFDLPPREVQDAWEYSSVKDKTKVNLCFRPEVAHEVLSLDGAMICRLSDNDALRVFCVAAGANDKGEINFFKLGSNTQLRVFPEIVIPSK